MSKNRFELNRAGVRTMLRSQGVMDECMKLASAAAGRCEKDVEISPYTGRNRVNVSLSASGADNALLRAMGGGA